MACVYSVLILAARLITKLELLATEDVLIAVAYVLQGQQIWRIREADRCIALWRNTLGSLRSSDLRWTREERTATQKYWRGVRG